MVEAFMKFINKCPEKERILDIVNDILHDRLDTYDIKPIAGKKHHFRIRSGNIRIIFVKTPHGNKIAKVGKR